MRVIAGVGKGTKLKAPKGYTTRPTTDRVKEAVFNILGMRVVGSVFLDLFGGTGAIAIEAISRGAEKAVVCDKDKNALQVINENMTKVQFAHKIHLLKQDALVAIKILAQKNYQFNIIYLDPPYESELLPRIIKLIYDNKLLSSEGLIVAETSNRENINEYNLPGTLIESRRYGDTLISIIQNS